MYRENKVLNWIYFIGGSRGRGGRFNSAPYNSDKPPYNSDKPSGERGGKSPGKSNQDVHDDGQPIRFVYKAFSPMQSVLKINIMYGFNMIPSK